MRAEAVLKQGAPVKGPTSSRRGHRVSPGLVSQTARGQAPGCRGGSSPSDGVRETPRSGRGKLLLHTTCHQLLVLTVMEKERRQTNN